MSPPTAQFLPIVAVPARNEEQRIPLLLSALNSQDWCRDNGPLTVVVVLNNCEDATREAVVGSVPSLTNLLVEMIDVIFPVELAHVGSARRLAMERAVSMMPELGRGVILTTDADAVPDRDWVTSNLRAIALGADLVGGKLYGNRDEEARLGTGFAARAAAVQQYAGLCDRLASIIDPLDYDPWPRHADHTGGSLAIRAELYCSLGGIPALPLREDLALVSNARARGAKLVHPLDVRVEVSARLAGRAPGGMADCLKNWMRAEAEGIPLLVEDPERVEARCHRRRAIRKLDCLHGDERETAGRRLDLDPSCLRDDHRCLVGAARLIEQFAPDDPDGPATVPVTLAIARLLEMIAERESADRAA